MVCCTSTKSVINFAYSPYDMKHEKRDMLLTDHQRDVLKGIKEVTDVAGRQNDKICRDKLEMYLNSASDATLILDMLPQLTAYIKEEDRKKFYDIEHLHRLLLVVEKLIALIDPAPIQPNRFRKAELEAVRKFSPKFDEPFCLYSGGAVPDRITSAVVTFHRAATPEEIALYEQFQGFEATIRALLNPPIVNTSLSLAELLADGKTKYPGFEPLIDSMVALPPTEEDKAELQAIEAYRDETAERAARPGPRSYEEAKQTAMEETNSDTSEE